MNTISESPLVLSLLVPMVTSTLTLVVISHRLHNHKKKFNVINELNGIIRLIWAHLFVVTLISFNMMCFVLFDFKSDCLEGFIFFAVFVILGIWWPFHFCYFHAGKCVKPKTKSEFMASSKTQINNAINS